MFCLGILLSISACTSVKLNLFSGKSEALKEFQLSGSGKNRILIIPINGMISNDSGISIFSEKAGMLENIKAQLQYAQHHTDIKGIVLLINSPGGLVTTSDIIYKELLDFKHKTGTKIVVSMMDIATSGAYLISLAADEITAHPTTVTGSVGVIFIRPELYGLMNKIGIGVNVSKSGTNKDMGSPFRPQTSEEADLFQNVINNFNNKFQTLVQKHRNLSEDKMKIVATARIFVADEALDLGLIDKICYLEDAIADCKKFAGLKKNASVVVFRRKYYANDNIYNTSQSHSQMSEISLIKLPVFKNLSSISTGFYSIWPGAIY